MPSTTPKQSRRRCTSRTWRGRQVGTASRCSCAHVVVMMCHAINAFRRYDVRQGAAECMLQMTPRSGAISTKQHRQPVAHVAQQRHAHVTCGSRHANDLQPPFHPYIHWRQPSAMQSAAFRLLCRLREAGGDAAREGQKGRAAVHGLWVRGVLFGGGRQGCAQALAGVVPIFAC
jgi:hypothetical protein